MTNNAQSQEADRAASATPGAPAKPSLTADDISSGLQRIGYLSWGIDQLMHANFSPNKANSQLHECTWAMSRIMAEIAVNLAEEIEERGIKS